MGTFSIKQSPASRDLYIYPNGDVVKGLLPIGETNHYECIDEARDVPDTTTYVYTQDDQIGTSMVSDMYTLQDHTTETGTINYITVYARAKSHSYQSAATAEYNILIEDGRYSNLISKASDINLSTDYAYYHKTWVSSPTDGSDWNWTEIDNLQIGIECNTPHVSQKINTAFRPNAAGSFAQCTPVGVANNWDCVNDVTPDELNTYVNAAGYVSGTFKKDLHNIPNHDASYIGTIHGVTVFCRGKSYLGLATFRLYGGMLINGTEYWNADGDDYFDLSETWTTYSYVWANSPDTSAAWTWAEIDGLEVGLRFYMTDGSNAGKYPISTQLYLVVNHTEDNLNPEIRTTQMYAKVNYTPDETIYTMKKPSNYTISNSREVKVWNLFSGDRIAYDLQRADKTLMMEGIEYGSTATDTLNDIVAVKDYGSEITITGMDDCNVNDTWMIRSFSYAQDEVNKNVWNWQMECESTS